MRLDDDDDTRDCTLSIVAVRVWPRSEKPSAFAGAEHQDSREIIVSDLARTSCLLPPPPKPLLRVLSVP